MKDMENLNTKINKNFIDLEKDLLNLDIEKKKQNYLGIIKLSKLKEINWVI